MSREYVLRIKDLPVSEKPRERLLALGAKGLTKAELLAVLWGRGTTKEGVLEMSERVSGMTISEYLDPRLCANELDIPLGKAMQLVASLELSRREGGISSTNRVIKTARDVFDYAQDIRSYPNEHLKALYLNADYGVIHEETISVGTVDASSVHPRDVFKRGLEHGALGIVLVHNHPSGNVNPSLADKRVTKLLVESGKMIGINVVDHVIVTKDSFKSISIEYV